MRVPELPGAGGEVVRGVGQVFGRGGVRHRGQHAAGRLDHAPARLHTTYTFSYTGLRYTQIHASVLLSSHNIIQFAYC